MRDVTHPEQLVDAVAEFLRERVLPGLDPTLAYELRVGINALALAARAMRQEGAATAREMAGLQKLLGDSESDVETLNARLCDAIASGDLALDRPDLIEHLWTRALDRLAIDQPGYSAYRRYGETAED